MCVLGGEVGRDRFQMASTGGRRVGEEWEWSEWSHWATETHPTEPLTSTVRRVHRH